MKMKTVESFSVRFVPFSSLTTITTYATSRYFCNILTKHLRHTSKTSETLETYACNMCFSTQHLLAAWTIGGSSTQSSTPTRSLIPRRGAQLRWRR
jgi:hypothetical protein